jgi:hypothetical protein
MGTTHLCRGRLWDALSDEFKIFLVKRFIVLALPPPFFPLASPGFPRLCILVILLVRNESFTSLEHALVPSP